MRHNRRFTMRSKFSIQLWNRWLSRLNGPDPNDPQYKFLKEGIAHFRQTLESLEKS